MAQSAIVEDAFVPLASEKALERGKRNKTARAKLSDDFGQYEIAVMATTQLGYIPVAGTMLATTFFEPSRYYCETLNTTSVSYESLGEFYSLLFEWELVCKNSVTATFVSVALMTGALVGAFVAGWLADLYGRCPVLKGCLFVIVAGNLLVSFVGAFSVYGTSIIFFFLGIACGGYMVVNLVMFVECLELPRARLLAVSTNGWSISMVAVALIAFLTRNYYHYHLALAMTAIIALVACNVFLVESCRWLDSAQRLDDAYRAALTIAKRNRYFFEPEWSWWEILRFSQSAAHTTQSEQASTTCTRTYNYFDLFSFPHVYVPLVALAYCFIASSIVSFGFYFILDVLPGNRYVNMSIMGLSKFLMGWIPFFVSPWMGRRPVVLFSIGIATIAAWISCITFFFEVSSAHWSHVALSLIVSASLDPTWKILHLYSTELFPTAVRNMARAVCNMGARLGSVMAPTIVHLRFLHPITPISVFTSLLTIQLIVAACCLPETKDKPLPSDFPPSRTPNNTGLEVSS